MSQINVKYINLPIPSFLKRFESKKELAKMSSSRATVGGGLDPFVVKDYEKGPLFFEALP